MKQGKKVPTVDEIVGAQAPASSGAEQAPASLREAGRANNFDGVVDDRLIPDAGVPTEYMEGVLDTAPEGHGYLRPKFSPSDKDVYISASQIRRFNLRPEIWLAVKLGRQKKKSVILVFYELKKLTELILTNLVTDQILRI